eukprot:6937041-Prymnesium_polylepis.1
MPGQHVPLVVATATGGVRAHHSRCSPSRIRKHRISSRNLRRRRAHPWDGRTNHCTAWRSAARVPARPVPTPQPPSNRASTQGYPACRPLQRTTSEEELPATRQRTSLSLRGSQRQLHQFPEGSHSAVAMRGVSPSSLLPLFSSGCDGADKQNKTKQQREGGAKGQPVPERTGT